MKAFSSNRWFAGLFGLIILIEQSLAASIEPVADVVKCAVHELQRAQVPDRVHLSGMLGTRIEANTKRLLNVDEDELLAGFRRRLAAAEPLGVAGPDEQASVGEHVGKWLHAATLAWVYSGDAKLREKLDRVVVELIKCQQPDGYLGTYEEKDRWTRSDVSVHKCDLLGLLTYYRYTGNKTALDSAQKIGDLLCETFGKDKHDIIKAGDHGGLGATSVLEPMVLLYRVTGDEKYREFCRYILWAWEQPHGPQLLSSLAAGNGVNKIANGKAYEMMSNLIGVCELYRTTGEKELLASVLKAWQDILDKRLYITGSVSQGGVLRDDHDLPNDMKSDAGETCVTVAWMELNAQLLRLKDDSLFAEHLERSLYNHLLAAQRPDGEQWCNETAFEGTKSYNGKTNCCLSSGPRSLALTPTFAYGTDTFGLGINLYESGRASLTLRSGLVVQLQQTTSYPGSGEVQILLNIEQPTRFPVKMRIPDYARAVSVSINDLPINQAWQPGTYGGLSRKWKDGDRIVLKFDIGLRVIEGTHANAGKLALMYGPLVLAADAGLNDRVGPLNKVSLPGDLKPLVAETQPITESRRTWPGDRSYQVQACMRDGSAVPLKFVPFAIVGSDGSAFQVWFQKAGDQCAK